MMPAATQERECIFCRIARHELPADIVYEDEKLIAFLDNHPVFPGHVLLCPRQHCETLVDLPAELAEKTMLTLQKMSQSVESALRAEGTFVAVNNRVSQTVAHLHIHVVPRKRRDGLRGFFWPRVNYQDEATKEAIRKAIESEIRKLTAETPRALS